MATKRRDPTAVRIGGRVREFRGRAGMSVPALAKAVGLDRSHVWRIEQGMTTPGVVRLQKIAKALGVTLADLVANGSSDPASNAPKDS